MLIAKQKRKENIVEYILYLYQVEDLIRAFKFDMDLIGKKLVNNYKADAETLKQIADWYSNLLIMMNKEGIKEKGHMQFLLNLVNDLNEFHLQLMEKEKDKMYVQIFQAVAGLINELKQKNTSSTGDVDLGITAIYGFLLLRMQQKNISNETLDAIKRISQWLAYLSKLYKDFEDGELEL